MCRFVADVGERNSGAADVAWRLLSGRHAPLEPHERGRRRGRERARARAARRPGRERQPVGVQAAPRRPLRRAPKPATLLRLAGGVRNAKFERSFDGRRVAPALEHLPGGRHAHLRVAASVAWSRLDSKQRRRARDAQPTRPRLAGRRAAERGGDGRRGGDHGQPPRGVLRGGGDAPPRGGGGGDEGRLAPPGGVPLRSGDFAAFDGSPARAEERLRAAAEAADLAEAEETARPRPAGREGGPPGGPPESGERLTAAAARAALSDIKLHAVVARADEKLAAGATAELLDTLGALLFPSQEEAEVQREGSHAPVVLTTDERKHALRVARDAARVEAAKARERAAPALPTPRSPSRCGRRFPCSTSSSPPRRARAGRRSAVEVSKAMPPLWRRRARGARRVRGARAFERLARLPR